MEKTDEEIIQELEDLVDRANTILLEAAKRDIDVDFTILAAPEIGIKSYTRILTFTARKFIDLHRTFNNYSGSH